MRKSCQIAKAKLRSILYQQDTPGSFAPLNCVLCCCISVTDINSIWISVSACLQLLHASMSVLEAAFITRGIANPGAVGEFWTAQGFRDHHNRLWQTPLVLKFLWGQKEDIVFFLLPSSPGSSLDWPQGSLSITCTSGKMYSCFLTPEYIKQSWQSHLLHPQLKALIQPIHDTSVGVSLEDPALPTVFQHLYS